MLVAVVIGSKVVLATDENPSIVEVPDGFDVNEAWHYDGKFIAPPAIKPWETKVLNGVLVDVITVQKEDTFPPGVNVSVVDGVVAQIETVNGWVKVSEGDAVCKPRPDCSDDDLKALSLKTRKDLFIGQGIEEIQ